jgi:hypothetical protein
MTGFLPKKTQCNRLPLSHILLTSLVVQLTTVIDQLRSLMSKPSLCWTPDFIFRTDVFWVQANAHMLAVLHGTSYGDLLLDRTGKLIS